ncbi:MAG: serine/threonine protein kinase [Chloroflexi bacterium]|nr:serine/threonine protein kinase [Chloroflexota bacterium]
MREADYELERLIGQRDYVTLIGPRYSGKSSMLMRQIGRFRNSSLYIPIYLLMGSLRGLPEPDWYAHIHRHIAQETYGLLPVPTNPARHQLALLEAIVNALANELRGRVLVFMLDQVEATPPEYRNSFFASVRSMFIERFRRPWLNNVIFVLSGRFVPDELIPDPADSPFRVAKMVYVDDADLEGITHLIAWLGHERCQIASDVPARIFEWTDGDIYLTHKLCTHLARDVPEGAILINDVDRAVRRYLFQDDLFRRMWRNIQADLEVANLIDALLDHGEPIPFTLLQRPVMTAWLEGAIKRDTHENCMVRSLVHESVFYSHQHTYTGPRPDTTLPPNGQPVLHNRYRIDQVLKTGVTCSVLRATDLNAKESVVIKKLTVSQDSDPTAWLRFQREGDALKQLEHPNIVRLLETFNEDDFDYIVMEYIYGGSLFNRLSQGRLPLRQALEIAQQVADALHCAHTKNVVHRDVKPSNVLLTPDYKPKLADFGVARLTTLRGITRETPSGVIIGTIPYLSPEGCRGDKLDARTDIWSLGIMLFEMLTGTLPFMGRGDHMFIYAILENPLPDVRTIRPEVPQSVVDLLEKMLNKERDQRIATAREVRDALHNILLATP